MIRVRGEIGETRKNYGFAPSAAGIETRLKAAIFRPRKANGCKRGAIFCRNNEFEKWEIRFSCSGRNTAGAFPAKESDRCSRSRTSPPATVFPSWNLIWRAAICTLKVFAWKKRKMYFFILIFWFSKPAHVWAIVQYLILQQWNIVPMSRFH